MVRIRAGGVVRHLVAKHGSTSSSASPLASEAENEENAVEGGAATPKRASLLQKKEVVNEEPSGDVLALQHQIRLLKEENVLYKEALSGVLKRIDHLENEYLEQNAVHKEALSGALQRIGHLENEYQEQNAVHKEALSRALPRIGHLENEVEGLKRLKERLNKLGLDDIKPYFHITEKEACKELHICTTSLKALCRRLGIKRWPYRKIKKRDTQIAKLKEKGDGSAAVMREIKKLTDSKNKIINNTMESGLRRGRGK